MEKTDKKDYRVLVIVSENICPDDNSLDAFKGYCNDLDPEFDAVTIEHFNSQAEKKAFVRGLECNPANMVDILHLDDEKDIDKALEMLPKAFTGKTRTPTRHEDVPDTDITFI